MSGKRGSPMRAERDMAEPVDLIGLIDAAEEDGAGYCEAALPHLPFSTTARRAYAIGSLPKGRFGQAPPGGDRSQLSPDTTQPW